MHVGRGVASYTEGRRNMKLFADKVMPELQSWDAPPVGLAARVGV